MIRFPRIPLTPLEAWALAGAWALALSLMWPLRGYLTDDTFIHLQYARHLAAGQGMVFNVGERVYGSTSPLWVAVLAGAMALGCDGLVAARVIGAVATLVSIALFLQLMRLTVRTPALRASATVVWAGNAWMLRWSVSGMETALTVALILAGFVALADGRTPCGTRPARTGLLWTLAALARPEAVLLLILFGLFLLVDARRRGGVQPLIRGALGPVCVYGAWLLFARGYYGAFWPHTLAAKTAGADLAAYADSVWRQARIIGATDGLLAAALALGLILGERRPHSPLAQRLVSWGWVLALPILYAARGVQVLSRYLVPILPVLGWLAWRAAERWWVGEAPRPRRLRLAALLAATVAGMALVQNLLVYRTQVVPHVRTFSPALERSLVAWGRWFDRHAAPEAVIATPDIGAIGFYGRRRVVDLGGLVTPAMVPYLERAPYEEVVAAFDFARFSRPDYLVDRSPERFRLLKASPYASCLVPLGEARMPNLGVSIPTPVVYSFYRVDWTAYDSLRTGR